MPDKLALPKSERAEKTRLHLEECAPCRSAAKAFDAALDELETSDALPAPGGWEALSKRIASENRQRAVASQVSLQCVFCIVKPLL